MKTIKLTYPHNLKQENIPDTIAAIGFFDGLHKGHQKVIQHAVQLAKKHEKESAVISFHPHPSVVLNKSEKSVHYITTLDEKEEFLAEMGVDRLYIITFNKELSLLSPERFIEHFIKNLHITHLVAGFDYTFGHKGAGNMNNIDTYSQGYFKTTSIEAVTWEEEKVSSTRIRAHLTNGSVDKVKQLLGRPYQTKGIVVEGAKRGRKLGFPTANLHVHEEKFLPKQGVYAVKVKHNGKLYQGMTNLGVKPTFEKDVLKQSIEVNIFDMDEDLYGKELTIYWYQYVRDEKKFNSLDELIDQLKTDEKTIRNYFA